MKQISEGTLIYKKQISEGWRRIKKERQLKKLKLAGAIILGLLLFSLWVAASSLDRPSFAKEQIEEQIRPLVVLAEVKIPPILEKISFCEGKTQFDKNGEVIRGEINRDDIGGLQINEIIWGEKARKLGYNIYEQEGNEKMGIWLLHNYGTTVWENSSHCWIKLMYK